ncbi:hypothetical protein HanXRQr2_Chr02g0048321 [Helianthus annuus]|uniref:Uncharacterized protein n=1 Tax=Helianthus annuus TaxID=4232 RepID=A0A9K3JL05_HELAN|nr:hypothetical protein HanXRQr2_Chr02g0048321 [Helianthus annuus]
MNVVWLTFRVFFGTLVILFICLHTIGIFIVIRCFWYECYSASFRINITNAIMSFYKSMSALTRDFLVLSSSMMFSYTSSFFKDMVIFCCW